MESAPYNNRELSQLQFNHRVLQLAQREEVPLFERLKFLAIGSSNNIEFFKVRVGGLMMLKSKGIEKADAAGYSVRDQLNAISGISADMFHEMDTLLAGPLLSLLNEQHIFLFSGNLQQNPYRQLFTDEYLPRLTPISIEKDRPQTLLRNEALHLIARLRTQQQETKYAIIPVPVNTRRFIILNRDGGDRFILPLEKLIQENIHQLFPDAQVLSCSPFLVIRNAGMNVDEDISANFLPDMKRILRERNRSFCTRLDVERTIDPETLSVLKEYLGIATNETVHERESLLKQVDLFELMALGDRKRDFFPPRPPMTENSIRQCRLLFDRITEDDLLLIHPYESYNPVIRFIEEAADDEAVITIKQTLYRTSAQSPIIKALKHASSQGKSVTVLCELKARFDEARNIHWAEELEDAGINVVYGLKHLKTHAKVTLVLREESAGLKRYAHFGTGNYNEKTAELYTDVSLFTANEKLCRDAGQLFNIITGVSVPRDFHYLKISPISLKSSLLSMIAREIKNEKRGLVSGIRIKVNSLSDNDLVDALYKASAAGVSIQLNVRGICTLRAGVPGLSENIEVRSILGRYLEHSRILHFYNAGAHEYYISSADWMSRNQERRIEHLVPILSTSLRKRLRAVLDITFSNRADAWVQNGTKNIYERRKTTSESPIDTQDAIYEMIRQEHLRSEREKPLIFDTHESSQRK
ncbi:MAG: polyphosphate kinase 1 [Fibrobacterota bacterium]